MKPTQIQPIATSKETGIMMLWKIGQDVYIAESTAQMDAYELPMNKRWVCRYSRFLRFKKMFEKKWKFI